MRFTNCRALSAFSLLFAFAFSGAAQAQGETCRSDDARFTARAPALSQAGRREWSWEGRESLTIQGPLQVQYEAGGTPRIIATGDPAVVEMIEVHGGIVRMRPNASLENRQLSVVIRGMQLDKIALMGSGKLDLARLQKRDFVLCIQGSGTVDAFGQVSSLKLAIDGSGKANLDRLTINEASIMVNGSGAAYLGAVSRHASVRVNGSGSATIGPADDVDINVTGAGSARLTSMPRTSNFQVTGPGGIVLIDADGKTTQLARDRRREADRGRDRPLVVAPRTPRY